jgi:hypothetical protein
MRGSGDGVKFTVIFPLMEMEIGMEMEFLDRNGK